MNYFTRRFIRKSFIEKLKRILFRIKIPLEHLMQEYLRTYVKALHSKFCKECLYSAFNLYNCIWIWSESAVIIKTKTKIKTHLMQEAKTTKQSLSTTIFSLWIIIQSLHKYPYWYIKSPIVTITRLSFVSLLFSSRWHCH